MKRQIRLGVFLVALFSGLLARGCGDDDPGVGCDGLEGYVICGDECVDLITDPRHCGDCDNVCTKDQFCSAGACVDRCDHECRSQGELRCADPPENGVVSCGNHDSDVCLEWGGLTRCGAGETCSGGACSVSCANECEQDGAAECDDGMDGFRTCGDHDADSCLEWSQVTECGSDQICQDGQCVEGCIEPEEDCKEFDDCCDYPDQGYHCCPVFKICVKDFW